MTSKDEMRRHARARRKALVAAQPDAAERLAAHADALPSAGIVALYQAAGSELDVEPLAQRLVALGRILCLPVVVGFDAPLAFRAWTPGDPLVDDLAGIAAPLRGVDELTPDLILTPLLAFDAFGGRLGQGGGYYDRTFARLPAAGRIGVAYAGQEVAEVPRLAHDIALDGVLTETGYIPARKGE